MHYNKEAESLTFRRGSEVRQVIALNLLPADHFEACCDVADAALLRSFDLFVTNLPVFCRFLMCVYRDCDSGEALKPNSLRP